jgi:hypothetical protein
MLFHTDNLLALQAIAVGLAPGAADALSADARRRRAGAVGAVGATHAASTTSAAGSPPPDNGAYGWPLRLLTWVTVAAYALAGLAKLRESGLVWAEGEILRHYIAFDAVRKIEVGSVHSPFGAWLVAYEAPFRVIGALSLLLELGAPLALLHRRVGYAWVLGIWGFHLGVVLVMAIAFPYPLSGVAFAAFLPCERLWRWRRLRPVYARLAGTSGAAAPPA